MKLAVYDDHRLGLVRNGRLIDVSDLVGAGASEWPPVFLLPAIAQPLNYRAHIEEMRSLVSYELHHACSIVFVRPSAFGITAGARRRRTSPGSAATSSFTASAIRSRWGHRSSRGS